MKRFRRSALTTALLGAFVLGLHGPAAIAGHTGAAAGKKICKTKSVKGKKTKVCKTVKPTTPTPTPVTELNNGDAIDAWLGQQKFRGYMYLERHGQVLLSKGYGLADTASSLANAAGTKWPAFSQSRFMVALAVMRLVEAGKLSEQDSLCRYIDGCPAAWAPITVGQVLSNASGIAYFDPFDPGITTDTTMAACMSQGLVTTPGTAGPWSDCNVFLLSTIVQRVTGQNWEAAMQSLVFGPAGMTNSGRMSNALLPPQRGRLYRFGNATDELNYDGTYIAYTTVDDIVRLNHALLAGTLVSKATLDSLFVPRLVDGVAPDGTQVLRGYEDIIVPGTPRQYTWVAESDINGDGEDDTGLRKGFFLTVIVSRDAGTIQVEVVNDAGTYSEDDDNSFIGLTSKLLFGK